MPSGAVCGWHGAGWINTGDRHGEDTGDTIGAGGRPPGGGKGAGAGGCALARALNAAKARAREELAVAGHAALRPAVAALASALSAAAEANDRVCQIEGELNQQPDLRVAWRELFGATPMTGSRLDSWLTYCRMANLLD